jgi:hypothetical protein
MRAIEIELLPATYGVARLGPYSPVPRWVAKAQGFSSITRTDSELSVVCTEASIPPDAKAQRGFSCLRVAGPLDFAETGILAALTAPLAHAAISVFAVSTYDTDYLLIRTRDLQKAISTLSAAGHAVAQHGAA